MADDAESPQPLRLDPELRSERRPGRACKLRSREGVSLFGDATRFRPLDFIVPSAEDRAKLWGPFVSRLENYPLSHPFRGYFALPFRKTTGLRKANRLTAAVVEDLCACHRS